MSLTPKYAAELSSFHHRYDKLSPSFRRYLETLTAQHNATLLHDVANKDGYKVRADLERGHPENIGADLESTHPVIRTNPVTGYKSVFVNCLFTKRINGVSKDESDLILAYLYRLQAENHDLAVRFKVSSHRSIATNANTRIFLN